jgi:ABC-type uncharacterized transport system permease subunit
MNTTMKSTVVVAALTRAGTYCWKSMVMHCFKRSIPTIEWYRRATVIHHRDGIYPEHTLLSMIVPALSRPHKLTASCSRYTLLSFEGTGRAVCAKTGSLRGLSRSCIDGEVTAGTAGVVTGFLTKVLLLQDRYDKRSLPFIT